MRVLTVIYEFPPVGGGGGRAAFDICRGLAARGHQVVVLTAHMRGLPFEETKDGIRIVRIPSLRREEFRAGFSAMLAYVIAGLWAGIRLIRSDPPDIMHAHFAVPSGALAWALSLLTGVPYILTAHLGDVPGGVPEKTGKWFRWIKPFTRPIWRRAKKAIAVSEYTRQLALKHYRVPIQVIHNGAEISQLSSAEIRIHEPPRLVFAGRFMPQKNPLAIVEVLSQLTDFDWRCDLLGDGPLLEEVKRRIEAQGLSGRFTLHGWVTPDAVLTRFAKSDILFMPSLSEGLPVVGVQALACGLALVVSDIGGFWDLVEREKNGFLIPPHSVPAFADALRRLISDPETLLRFRRASLEKARQFDIEKIVEQYQGVLREALR
jgi:glycosyltransferase involved in cell wall biosynthesis